jgi:hypothetical protein
MRGDDAVPVRTTSQTPAAVMTGANSKVRSRGHTGLPKK